MPARTVERYQVALTSYCLINNPRGIFIINRNKSIKWMTCTPINTKNMLRPPQISQSLFTHIRAENNISLATDSYSIHCSCDAKKFCHSSCIISDSRTAVAVSILLQRQVCFHRENCISVSCKHDTRTISVSLSDTQNISHRINVHIFKTSLLHLTKNIFCFLLFLIRGRRNLAHFQSFLQRPLVVLF